MHILLIVNNYPTDWNFVRGIFYADQASALHEAGYQIGVLVESGMQSMLDYIAYHKRLPPIIRVKSRNNLPVYECYWGEIPKTRINIRARTKLWLARFTFQRYVKKFGKPDIIHAHNSIYSGYIGAILGKENSIPIVITEHSSAFVRGLIKEKQNSFVRFALDNTQRRLAVSEPLSIALNHFTALPIIVQPNMVDTDFFDYLPPVNSQTFVFSIIAELNENKRHRMLIDAFTAVFRDKPIMLMIAGDGDLRDTLEKYVSDLNMNRQIKFLGWLNRQEIRDVIYKSHCIISVSRVETFGLSLAEAMACGRPVIATRSGGPNTFVDARNGILVSVKGDQELISALQQMYENYDHYDTMAIRSACVGKFSKSALVNNLTQLYQSVLSDSNLQTEK
ncbi:MAG: glycosyltransferase [Aggregatilineales bacterium]